MNVCMYVPDSENSRCELLIVYNKRFYTRETNTA